MLFPCLTPQSFPPLAEIGVKLSKDDVDRASRLGVAGDIAILLPTPAAKDDTLKNAKPLLRAARVRVGPFTAADVESAISWLDNGAIAVMFDADVSAPMPSAGEQGAATTESTNVSAASVATVAEAISALPASRVMVRFMGEDSVLDSKAETVIPPAVVAALAALKPVISAVVLRLRGTGLPSDTVKQLRSMAGHHVALVVEQVADGPCMRAADVGKLHRHDVNVLSPAVRALSNEEVELGEAEGRLDVGTCAAACVRSDRPDGLFTTVVSDETGKTLGLVYSSKESIVEAVRCGKGVYYSRSRGGLWRKGDTSGNYQLLQSLRLDCDGDAVLFTVQQMGTVPAFCHLNTRTCWGEDGGLTALERTLAQRLVDAPPGSYTKRLFDDAELLRNKLLEEAQELAEATEPDHVAAEAADLLYFALVRCAKAGVSIADIEGHLDRRALKVRRRAGDSKPYRIAAASAYLDAMGKAKGAAVPAGSGAAAAEQVTQPIAAQQADAVAVTVASPAPEVFSASSPDSATAAPSPVPAVAADGVEGKESASVSSGAQSAPVAGSDVNAAAVDTLAAAVATTTIEDAPPAASEQKDGLEVAAQ